MKLLRVGDIGKEIPALLDNDNKIRSLKNYLNDFDPSTLIFEKINKIKTLNSKTLPEIPPDTRIGSCISKPEKFIGIGLNFSDHAAEQGLPIPKEPIVFAKATSSIIGPYDDVIIPPKSNKTDWEVEIAFVVGKKAKNVSEQNAPNYILGYCLVDDISEREWQKERGGQWTKGKSADTFGPIGPYLVTQDEISNVQNLNMYLEINGKKMQTGNTSKMIFKINYLLSYLSNFMTLMPGDIVTTGTPPGVGDGMKPPIYLKRGDNMKLRIDSLGEQNHRVI